MQAKHVIRLICAVAISVPMLGIGEYAGPTAADVNGDHRIDVRDLQAIIAKALPMYQDLNIDFIDAYIAALMDSLNISEIYSFDKKHISRVKKIKRIEP